MLKCFSSPEQADAFIRDQLIPLPRRGFQLGWLQEGERPSMPDAESVIAAWKADRAAMLPGIIDVSRWQEDIEQAERLMKYTLEHEELSPAIDGEPYLSQVQQTFPLIATSYEEHDEQGVEKLYFDAEQDGEVVAEDLWCKSSWLSFIEEDASLRFRFSFGMECLEDVAADPVRQYWAGKLCDAMFPESASISENNEVIALMRGCVGGEPAFVERIVYFNAPNGGAQMHHDVERGHDGVIFAQLSGSTFWLAAAKPILIDELLAFCRAPENGEELVRLLPAENDRKELGRLLEHRDELNAYMDEQDHELVEAVMDRSAIFFAWMVERGYGYVLKAGDALLIPQRDLDNCVWHSVTCVGDEPGEALSFAVRAVTA